MYSFLLPGVELGPLMTLKKTFFLDLCYRMEKVSGGWAAPCVECRERKESFPIYTVGCGENSVCKSYNLSETNLDDTCEEL